jgi:CBF1 interacting corepressor
MSTFHHRKDNGQTKFLRGTRQHNNEEPLFALFASYCIALMVAGLKFLSKKSFNPQNTSNQKTVWERQQERAQAEKRIQDRERQLQRERDDEELQRARGEVPRLQFLYAVPPGLEARPKDEEEGSKGDGDASLDTSAEPTTIAHPDAKAATAPHEPPPPSTAGNLDPAAAFREYLESAKRRAAEKEKESAASNVNGEDSTKDGSHQTPGSFGTVLQGTSHDPVLAAMDKKSGTSKAAADAAGGSSSALSALEKAVGRKHQHAASGSLSLEEQIQRFPALAHAPRQKGISASHVGVSFKPLGAQIRNVRCMACGIWGHSRGERECRVSGWNPFDGAGGVTAAQAVAPPSRSKEGSAHGAASSQRQVPPLAEPHGKQQRLSRRDVHDNDEKRRREVQVRTYEYDDARPGGLYEKDRVDADSDEDEDSRDSRGRNDRRRKKKKHKSKRKRSRSRHRRDSSRKRRSESDGGESEGAGTRSDSESSRRKRKKHRKHRERES